MKIFPFILLLISSNCFLIYEKIPLATYLGKIREELKEIFALRFLENIEYEDFNYSADGVSYTLSNVKPQSVHMNLYMPSAIVSTSSGLKINLNWQAKITTNYISPYHLIYIADLTSNNQKYKIQFEMESAEFNFIKSWEYYESDQFYIPKGEIANVYSSFKAKCVDSNCPYTTDGLLPIINSFISENQDMMNNVLNNGIDSYYKSLPFEEYEQKIYTRTASSISNENNLDLSIEIAPEYDNGIFIFKRKGTLNGQETQQGSTIDSTINQSFNLDYKIYQKLIQDNQFDIKYEAQNNPASKYELTLDYLKKVVNLNSSYEDDTEFKLEAIMKNVEFSDIYNPLKGVVTIDVNIISREDLSTAFSFTLKLDFVFDINLFQNGLNFVLLAKNIVINDVLSDEDIIDMDLLKEWIENTYLCALGNNEFRLMTIPMDLSYYFKGKALKWEFVGNYLSVIKN